MRKQVSLSEVLDASNASLKESMYHVLPGIVHEFHPGTAGQQPATVDVLPAVNDPRSDTVTGQPVAEPFPVIPNIPIVYPRGGGYVFAFPLAAGDHVTLIAYDLDPTLYWVYGEAWARSSASIKRGGLPLDLRRHAGAYWLALPSDLSDPGAMLDSSAASNELVIGVDGAAQQIRINGTNVSLGASASDFVALASLVKAELSKVVAALGSAAAPSGGGPVTYGHPYTTAGDVGSTLVKSG